MKKKLFALTICALAIFASCEKDPEPTGNNNDNNTAMAAYVLSEGNWGGNNATLGLLTSETLDNDWFTTNNNRGLGELAQDAIHYGSRLYVTVSGSEKVEVIDTKTGKSIKQIDFGQKYPRYMVAHEGKVYVTSYDKTVVRIDTTALEIEATCQLTGLQPEQLCLIGNNLYICNTWENGSDGNAIYDNTISVVDLASFTEARKIQVGTNPGKIKALDNHRFIVACGGNYGDEEALCMVVDVNNDSKTTLAVAASNFDVCDNTVYMYATTYAANWTTITSFYTMDINTLQPEQILQDFSDELSSAYAICVNPTTKQIFVSNSVYGATSDIYIFSPAGEKLRQAEGGLYTNKIIF